MLVVWTSLIFYCEIARWITVTKPINPSNKTFLKMKNPNTKNLLSVSLMLLLVCSSYAQQKVFGTVTNENAPLKDVVISLNGSEVLAHSDVNGKYEVSVREADNLQFAYDGMKTVTIKIEDVTRVLNITMLPKVMALENITVKEKRKTRDLESDYASNEDIIRTAYGFINAKVSATSVAVLKKKQIGNFSCILDVLRSRFPGIRVTGDCFSGGSVTGASGAAGGLQAANVLFDVDGQVSTDAPLWLDPAVIERMAVLSGRASAGFYSSLGVNVVIIVNTALSIPNVQEKVASRKSGKALLEGPVLTAKSMEKNLPEYLKQLHETTSLEAAKKVFEKYKTTYGNSSQFILDTYGFFADVKNDLPFADQLLEQHYHSVEDDVLALKALAYMFEAQQRYEKAHEAYTAVFKKRARYAQSYFDMANSYRNLGDFKKSKDMYTRYNYMLHQGILELDTTGFTKIMGREHHNLLKMEQMLSVKNDTVSLNSKEMKKGFTRLVIEWNDSEAEFQLGVVDPDKNLYEWKHSLADNPESVKKSKDFGYNISEKALDPSLKGDYEIFVKYLGNKSLTPSYLKVTTYHDYGTITQKKDVKVFRMTLKNVNQELMKINNAMGIVSLAP